jgi:hypothetical protein
VSEQSLSHLLLIISFNQENFTGQTTPIFTEGLKAYKVNPHNKNTRPNLAFCVKIPLFILGL